MATSHLMLRDGHRAQTIYTAALRSAYQHGVQLQDPDWSQFREPQVWEMAWRDPIVAQALQARLHRVAGGEPQIQPGARMPTPADEATASAIETIVVDELDDKLHDARAHLATSIFRGRGVGWILGERRPMTVNGVHGQWWVPTKILHLDKRSHRFVAENGPKGEPTGKRRHELYSVRAGEFRPVRDAYLEQLIFMAYDDDQSRLGHGRGILEAIWQYMRAKGHAFRFGMQGLERWAKGIVHVGVDADAARLGTNEEIVTDYLTKYRNMADEGILVTNSSDTVQLLTGAAEGWQQVQQAMDRLDAGITRMVGGSLLPFGGGEDVGSNARAEVEQESTESINGYDRRKLDGVFTRRLIRLAYYKNLHLLRKMPEGAGACPKLRSVSPQSYDPEVQVRVATGAVQMGAPIVRREFYERIGYSVPNDDDDVLTGPEPLAVGAGALGLPGIDFDAA